MTFGEKLKELRTAAGLSQKALADAAGVAQQAVGHWESGIREPGWGNVMSLCQALGVDCTAFANCEDVVGQNEQPPAKVEKKPKGKKGE